MSTTGVDENRVPIPHQCTAVFSCAIDSPCKPFFFFFFFFLFREKGVLVGEEGEGTLRHHPKMGLRNDNDQTIPLGKFRCWCKLNG